jgi:thiamine transport system ATP-binding protein
MLEIRQLEFAYQPGDERMRFDLDVAPGEVLSLIGPSGSGKSTLLALVAGFLRAATGRILLDGRAIETLPAERRPVSIVFQQHNLFPHLDLYTNVALGADPSLRLSSAQSAEVDAALARLGLADYRRRKPGELSGGQRQRAALARVLVRRRRILLLDEAFAALGPAQRAELIGLVKDLVREHDMMALLVSHQPRDALLASARTAFVCDGRILTVQGTRELLDNAPFSEVRDYLGAI